MGKFYPVVTPARFARGHTGRLMIILGPPGARGNTAVEKAEILRTACAVLCLLRRGRAIKDLS